MKTVDKTQDQAQEKGFIAKAKDAIHEHSLKAAVVATTAVATTSANAAINVDAVVTSINGLDDPINKIGAALLGIAVVILGWRLVRSVIR